MIPSEGEEIASEDDNKQTKGVKQLADSYNNNSQINFDSSLRENFERKSREQAKIINELHSYKALCEKRIKQLSPNHPIPIKEAHLNIGVNQIEQIASGNLDVENHNLKKEIQNLRNIINYKDQEINQMSKKIESYSFRLNQVVNESVPKSHVLKKDTPKKTNDFPTVDRVPQDKLKESYQRLQTSYNGLLNEKEVILDSLRNETLTNEEQRNYIEILKQTLESKISSIGIKNFLNQQKHNYYGKDASEIDVLVDFSQLKADCETSRKELIMANVIINELKQENDFLKKINEDLTIKNQMIRENFDNILREIDELKEKDKEKDIFKNNLEEVQSIIKGENERLVKDYDNITHKNRKLEKENSDLSRKINELNLKLNEMSSIQGKLNEYKRNYEKLNEEYSSLINEKTKIEEEHNMTQDNLTAKAEEVKVTKMSMQNQIEKFEGEIKYANNEIINLQNKIKKLDKQIIDLQTTIKDSKNDYKMLEERCNFSDNLNNNLKVEKEKMQNNIEDLKAHNEAEVSKLEQQLRESHSTNKDLKYQFENALLEKKNLNDDNNKLKREILNLETEFSKLKGNLDVSEKNLNKQNDQYDEIIYKYRELECEKTTLLNEKEKLLKDIMSIKEAKEEEYKKMNSYTILLNQDLKNCNEKNSCLTQKNGNLQGEISQLKISLNEKTIKLEELLKNEIAYKRKEEHANLVSSKLDGLHIEHTNLIKDFNDLTEKLEHENREKGYMYESLMNKDKFLNNLNDENTKLKNNINQLCHSKEELFSKYEKLGYENNQLNKKLNDALNENNINSKRIDELSMKFNETNYERENIENIRKNLIIENEVLKNNENELNSLCMNLQNFISEIKLSAQSSSNSIQNNFSRFINNKFSKNLVDFLTHFNINYNHDSNVNPIDFFKFIDQFSNLLSCELETFFNQVCDFSEITKSNNNRTQNLEYKLSNVENEKILNESNLRNQLKQFAEDNKTMIIENENVNRKYEKLFQDFKLAKADNMQIKEENSNLIFDNKRLKESQNGIVHEKAKLEDYIKGANNNIKALEERMVITIQERTMFETLLTKISNTYPNREISKTINECLNVIDMNVEIEREKLKIEQRINLFNNELLYNENSNNSELKTNIKMEIENLKNLYCEYNDRLEQNNKKHQSLEEDIKIFEIKERKKNEKLIEYEQLIAKLKRDYNDAQEDLKKSKPVSIFKTNYSLENKAFNNTNSSNKPLQLLNNNPNRHSSDIIKTEPAFKTDNSYLNKTSQLKPNSSFNFPNFKTVHNPSNRYEAMYTTNNEDKFNKTHCTTLPAYDNLSGDNSYLFDKNSKNITETENNEFQNQNTFGNSTITRRLLNKNKQDLNQMNENEF